METAMYGWCKRLSICSLSEGLPTDSKMLPKAVAGLP